MVEVLAVLVPTGAVAFAAWLAHRERAADRQESRDAHAAIGTRIERAEDASRERDQAIVETLRTMQAVMESQRTATEGLAREVAFLHGRQAERDQSTRS